MTHPVTTAELDSEPVCGPNGFEETRETSATVPASLRPLVPGGCGPDGEDPRAARSARFPVRAGSNARRRIVLETDGNAVEEAEGLFGQSLEIARRQEAKSFELRDATSLARLWQRRGAARAQPRVP